MHARTRHCRRHGTAPGADAHILHLGNLCLQGGVHVTAGLMFMQGSRNPCMYILPLYMGTSFNPKGRPVMQLYGGRRPAVCTNAGGQSSSHQRRECWTF